MKQRKLAEAIEACRNAAYEASDFSLGRCIEQLALEAAARCSDSYENVDGIYDWLFDDEHAMKRLKANRTKPEDDRVTKPRKPR
jgi:hypothetical protein